MSRKSLCGPLDLQFVEVKNSILPKDWTRVLVKRQEGKTKDLIDIYIIAPDGKKLRSSVEFVKHMSKTKTECKLDPDECVGLFTKSNLKAENFTRHELLIKLVPSLATEAQRESMGIALPIRKRGRPKKVSTDIDKQDVASTSDTVPHKEDGCEARKPGRPRKNYPDIDKQDVASTSDTRPHKEDGCEARKPGRPRKNYPDIVKQDLASVSDTRSNKEDSCKTRKPGRPRKNFPVEVTANENQLSALTKSSENNPQKENLRINVNPRKRGRPKSDTDKHLVIISENSEILSALGKESRIFKRRKRRGRPKSINFSNECGSSGNNEIVENPANHHETRADKCVQTDEFFFTFKNLSSNLQGYDCITSQNSLQVIENIPARMVLTSFETDEASVPKRFTYFPSSVSKVKWDSVSGTYAVDVEGKVIPGVICNDEEYSRLEDEDPSQYSLSINPDIKDIYDSEVNIEEFEETKMCDVNVPRNYIIDHSSGVTIIHRPKARDSTWIPPKSPYDIIQQLLYEDPWKLLISTFFEECHDPKHFWKFTDKWPSAKELLTVNVRTLADFLQECGIHRLRAGTFLKFTDDFLHTDWMDPINLFGIRNFGRECYILFYLGEWQTFKPKSGMLKLYLKWYHENFVNK